MIINRKHTYPGTPCGLRSGFSQKVLSGADVDTSSIACVYILLLYLRITK